MRNAWPITNLGSVASVVASGVDKHIHADETPVRLCNYLDVYRNRRLAKPYEFSAGSVRRSEAQKFTIKKGDIIITKDSESPDDIGVPCLIADDFASTVCGYHLALIRSDSAVNSSFLSYLLQTEATRRFFLSKADGLTRFALTARTIASLPVPLPSLDKQVAIARVFDAVEFAVSRARRALSKAEQLQRCLMRELLAGRIRPDGSARQAADFWVHDRLGNVPQGWEVGTVRLACDVLDHLRRPVKKEDRAAMRGIYPYYGACGIVDYVNDYLFDGSYILFGEDGENLVSRKLPQAILVNGKFWVNNHAHILTAKAPHCIAFICAQLEAGDYRPYVYGSAQPKMNKTDLLRIRLLLPAPQEQTAIAARIMEMNQLIEAKRAKITALQRLKKSLMQNLLTGRMRLSAEAIASLAKEKSGGA